MQCTSPYYVGGTGPVPCGRCMSCRIARSREWAIRLVHEQESWEDSCFVTLTYADEYLPDNQSLVKKDLQNYFKRLRKSIYPLHIKYFACGEYGETYERPHYHAIIFGLAQSSDVLKDNWTAGFVRTGTVTFKSCRYVAGYIQKKITGDLSKSEYGVRVPPFQLQSQGLGLAWAIKNKQNMINNLYITTNGVKTGLPRYYVKKLKNEMDEELATTKKMLGIVKLNTYLQLAGIKENDEWKYLKDLRKKKELELEQKLNRYRPRDF